MKGQSTGKISGEGMSAEEFFRYSLERAPSRHAVRIGRSIGEGCGACLDVGCGAGLSLKEVARLAGSRDTLFCGCDIDEELLSYAARKGPRPEKPVIWVCNGPDSLPFAGGSFDFVYSEGTLHHFENPGAMLSEMWRVLAPGGELLIMDINPESAFARAYRAFAVVKSLAGLAGKGEKALASSITHAFPGRKVLEMGRSAGIQFRTSTSLAAIYYRACRPAGDAV